MAADNSNELIDRHLDDAERAMKDVRRNILLMKASNDPMRLAIDAFRRDFTIADDAFESLKERRQCEKQQS